MCARRCAVLAPKLTSGAAERLTVPGDQLNSLDVKTPVHIGPAFPMLCGCGSLLQDAPRRGDLDRAILLDR